MSQVEFLELSQRKTLETCCEEIFSLIKNESYGIADDQTLSVHVWFKYQWTCGLLCWFVGMCEDGFAGDDAPCYSARNKFERFRGFLELISRFEFVVRRRGNFFLKDSNFWCVQSSTIHNVAVHVQVLWPVCTHTIPFRM